jgi:hypothetical protein
MKAEILAAVAAVITGLAPTVMALKPQPNTPVAVIVAPWQPPSAALRVVALADGRVIASAGRTIIIARSDNDASDNTFIDRLYAAGATLVINAATVSGCAQDSSATMTDQVRS